MVTARDRDRLVERLRQQSTTAARLGSPLYERLLGHAAEDVAEGGPCAAVLGPFAHEPHSQAVPLRFMAAAHRLVLRREAPELALHYPSVGGTAGLEGAWPAFRRLMAAQADAMTTLTALPCQTNEVGRSAALGAGLAWLAARHDLPVHHLELGTSAGLNLRWDRFRYGTGDDAVTWGPVGSPVDLRGHWLDAPRGLPPTVEVVSRRGCDPNLLDPADAGDREALTAAVWADMPERHARLKGALALAAEVAADTERARAGEWLDPALQARGPGLAVVTHSVVWRYLPEPERTAVTGALATHGAEATPERPLVWLRLEPREPTSTYDGEPYPILATTWPGGRTEELGTAHAHGQEVRWTAGRPDQT